MMIVMHASRANPLAIIDSVEMLGTQD